jgi:hypothetical protein
MCGGDKTQDVKGLLKQITKSNSEIPQINHRARITPHWPPE